MPRFTAPSTCKGCHLLAFQSGLNLNEPVFTR